MNDPERALYEAQLAAAGITILPERDAAMFEAFLAYRELAAVFDEALPYTAEPAAIYPAPEGEA